MSEETMNTSHDDMDVIFEMRRDELAEELLSGNDLHLSDFISTTYSELVEEITEDADFENALLEIIEQHPTSELAKIASRRAHVIAEEILETDADYGPTPNEKRFAALCDREYDRLRENGDV